MFIERHDASKFIQKPSPPLLQLVTFISYHIYISRNCQFFREEKSMGLIVTKDKHAISVAIKQKSATEEMKPMLNQGRG